MRALVTGACGFIGSQLTPRLLDQGMEVRALAFPGEDAGGLASLGAEVRFGDITEPQSLEGLCDGVDIVFHLAGRIAIWGPRRLYFRSIVEGTRNLLEESHSKVSRFVYASSVCAIGTNRHLAGHREDDPVRRTGIPYADAKQEAEGLVREYHAAGALEGTVFRPTNVIGPGSTWVRDIVDTLRGGILPLFDGGRHSASLVYVDNLVDGIVLAGTLQAAAGKTYHFRDDWDVTWKRYLNDIGAVAGKVPRGSIPFRVMWPLAFVFEKTLSEFNVKPPATRHIVGLLGRDLDVDNTRAKEELGWRTRVSYEEAMQRIRDWVLTAMPE